MAQVKSAYISALAAEQPPHHTGARSPAADRATQAAYRRSTRQAEADSGIIAGEDHREQEGSRTVTTACFSDI